jgi:signal transduction histidine kinase
MRWRTERRERKAQLAELPPRRVTLEGGTTQALVQLSRRMSIDWDVSIRRIVQFDADVLQVERVSFWSLADDEVSIRCEAGYVVSLRSFEHGATLLASELPEYFEALREERVLDMVDVHSDPRCRGLRSYCAAREVASMLDVPVWVKGRLCGILCHEHVGSMRRWTTTEQDFATGVSQIASSALAARAQTRAEASAHRATFLDTVSRTLSSLDPKGVARRAVSLAVPELADAAAIWVLNREGVLECAAVQYAPSSTHGALEARPALTAGSERRRSSLATLVVRQRQALLIPELAAAVRNGYGISSDDRALLERLGVTSAIAVPLSVDGNTLGAMIFLAGDRRRYSEFDREFAETMGDRVAAALDKAHLYEVAREAIRARDELLVLAAHELRTPLTALQLMTDNLLRKARSSADPSETTRFEGVAKQVRRFGTLVDHIFDALTMRAEGVLLVTAPCDLAGLVKRRVGAVAERANGRIAIDVSAPVVGRWDGARLEQVVDQLLDNALKFGEGKPIDVRLRADVTEAELSVRDHGMGIPPERLQWLFDPFERAVPKEHFGGLGLGLYIARMIVEAHGGAIRAISHPGGGATFVVRIPLAAR